MPEPARSDRGSVSAPVVFDHPSGLYESGFHLVLSTPFKGATILYTTNGSAPVPAAAFRYLRPLVITTTTVLRAVAFKEGRARTPVATRTYVFPSEVLRQDAPQFPKYWGTNNNQPIPAAYTMGAGAAADPGSPESMGQAFRALPSLSIVANPVDLFSAGSGIYLHPEERGSAWERPASVEWFLPGGQGGFQIDCGVRVHGGMSRHPEESPKHSFRLVFRKRYGAVSLRFPLFGTNGPQEFDELVLRGGGNDSWLDSDGERRHRATLIRDEWMRRSLRDLGYPSARGMFVHLYLNGLYWGLYNLCERPSPSLVAGVPAAAADYDFRKADQVESGDSAAWDKIMELAEHGLAGESNYQAIGRLLDLPQLADYLILNFYAGNTDWDRSANWYAYRPRLPGGRFRFLVWDAECTLGDVERSTVEFDDDRSPPHLFHKLSENAAFRTFFAERARKVLSDSGPLAPGPAATRWRTLADSVAPAMVAEAARWGAYRAEVHPYKSGPFERCTVERHWQREEDRILNHYFPQRREVLLNQFRERGLASASVNRPVRR